MKDLVSFVQTDKIKEGEHEEEMEREGNWGWHAAWMTRLIEQKIEAGLPGAQKERGLIHAEKSFAYSDLFPSPFISLP